MLISQRLIRCDEFCWANTGLSRAHLEPPPGLRANVMLWALSASSVELMTKDAREIQGTFCSGGNNVDLNDSKVCECSLRFLDA